MISTTVVLIGLPGILPNVVDTLRPELAGPRDSIEFHDQQLVGFEIRA
jgi:hypothetical protein